MNRSKLLIVTAAPCGACRSFKSRVLGLLLEKLKTVNCQVTHVDFKEMYPGELTNTAPDIPASVQTYIRWYPTLLLFPPNSWEPEVFNGKKINGSVEVDQKYDYEPEVIVDWINKNINNNSRFSTLPKGKVRYVLVKDGKPMSLSGPRFVKRNYQN